MELDDTPWLAAIGALLMVPLLFNFDVNLLLPLLTNALFLIVLGFELSRSNDNNRSEEMRSGWIHAGWMGVTWGAYQLMRLVDMGLAPIRFVLSLVLLGLAVQYFALQYFSQPEFAHLPDIERVGTLSTPLLILAAFMFINLIGNTSLVTGAIFLTAAGHLIKDENEYAGYLAPLGALLVGYAVIL